jgi:cobalt-zinc-cadmium efflux system membrane fusion protein
MRQRVFFGGALAALAAGATVAAILWAARSDTAIESAEPSSPEVESAPQLVKLSPAKIDAAGVRLAAASVRELQPARRAPGRIQYNESNHVAVRAPVAGVLTEVLVQPADVVIPGQPLAWLSSPEVGEARAEALRRESVLEIAQSVLQRDEEILAGVQDLISQLTDRAVPSDIDERLAGRSLGEFGETLLAAYSQLLLAEELYTQGQTVAPGAVSGSVQRQRRSDWEVAKARFHAAVETAKFETRRRRDESKLAADDARRRVDVSRQRLRLLTGDAEETASNDLSLLVVTAPIGGTVEERFFSRTEHVAASDSLFIIADPSALWVAAAVRENEWEALQLAPGAELTIEPTAIPGSRYTARVVYAGRNVDATSHAASIVAALEDSDDRLRPGMYAAVWLPLGPPINALAVAPSSVMQHEGQRFVFVAEDEHTFRRVNVETGQETQAWIEIRRGLAEGMQVVEQGAFELKSELLLERED